MGPIEEKDFGNREKQARGKKARPFSLRYVGGGGWEDSGG